MISSIAAAKKFDQVWGSVAAGIVLALAVAPLSAQDWSSVPLRLHREYQAIEQNGPLWQSAYVGGWPLRLQGVVLNANEDWLDPTSAYDAGYHPWALGGQAEIIVQTIHPDDPEDPNYDFGGTYCWMGQNYGNLPMRQDPSFSYTEEEWYGELDRLRLSRPASEDPAIPAPLPPERLVRPGDYVEVRARAGLEYKKSKENVNEQHYNDPDYDFEIVVLEQGRGWEAPVDLTLADLKNPDDSFIFDTEAGHDPRDSGPEHYQGTLVTLQNVTLSSGIWTPGGAATVSDGGRTISLQFGLGAGLSTYPAAGTFNVTGIMDQDSTVGNDGYRLLVLDSGDVFQRWAGGSGSWSSASLWGGNALLDGEGAHFSGTGGTATNDVANRVVGGIVFGSGAGAYTLDGQEITLTGDVISFSVETQTVALDVVLGDDEITLYPAAGDLVLDSALENNGYLRKIGYGAVALPGGVSGEGILHVTNGALTAASIAQGKLIIGGVAEETASPAAQEVPEPSVWLMLLAAGLVVGRRTVGFFRKILAKPQAVWVE